MLSESRDYLALRRIVRREPIYSANSFVDLVSDVPANEMTTNHLIQFRNAGVAAGLSPRTIESRIADLITVVKHATGTQLLRGNRLHVPRPSPRPVSIDVLCRIWTTSPRWLQQWIAISYWTGLRLSDTLRLQLSLTEAIGEAIDVSARKTGKQHVFPVPEWLRLHMAKTSLPYRRVTDFSRKMVRQSISSACRRAGGVTVWTPKQLRQASITEWSRANATAGAIVHGCGLGVLAHYLDPLSVLESAAPRVRIPACFGACNEHGSEDTLIAHFRRLDPAAQLLISGTAERLATG